MAKNDVASFLPVLNSEKLDEDVARALGRVARIYHVDSRFIITVERCGVGLRKSKFMEDGPKIPSMFGCQDSGIKFSLGGACCGECLCFAAIGNTGVGKKEGKTTGRTAACEVVGMSGIKETSQVRTGF